MDVAAPVGPNAVAGKRKREAQTGQKIYPYGGCIKCKRLTSPPIPLVSTPGNAGLAAPAVEEMASVGI